MAEIGNVTVRVDAVITDEQYHEAMSAVSAANEYIAALEADNAKLRVERDEWHRVAVSKQDIIDHMRDTSSSNMRLRELCADMFDGMCDHDHCYTCHHWQDGYNGCEYHERMAQLGVEVD